MDTAATADIAVNDQQSGSIPAFPALLAMHLTRKADGASMSLAQARIDSIFHRRTSPLKSTISRGFKRRESEQPRESDDATNSCEHQGTANEREHCGISISGDQTSFFFMTLRASHSSKDLVVLR
jgi:hypothetical protein